MSGVKNWLMEMQEYSQYILEVRDVRPARIMFIDKYWPDFTTNDYIKCLNKFKRVRRRFGRRV